MEKKANNKGQLAFERGYLSQRRPILFLTIMTFLILFVLYLLQLEILNIERNVGAMESFFVFAKPTNRMFVAQLIYKLNSNIHNFLSSNFGKQNLEVAINDGRQRLIDSFGTTFGRPDFLTATSHTVVTEPGYVH